MTSRTRRPLGVLSMENDEIDGLADHLLHGLLAGFGRQLFPVCEAPTWPCWNGSSPRLRGDRCSRPLEALARLHLGPRPRRCGRGAGAWCFSGDGPYPLRRWCAGGQHSRRRHWISAVSSRMTSRSSGAVFTISAMTAFASVVLPDPVPPEMMMFKRAPIALLIVAAWSSVITPIRT